MSTTRKNENTIYLTKKMKITFLNKIFDSRNEINNISWIKMKFT
jgi:hypothetical protein